MDGWIWTNPQDQPKSGKQYTGRQADESTNQIHSSSCNFINHHQLIMFTKYSLTMDLICFPDHLPRCFCPLNLTTDRSLDSWSLVSESFTSIHPNHLLVTPVQHINIVPQINVISEHNVENQLYINLIAIRQGTPGNTCLFCSIEEGQAVFRATEFSFSTS